MPRVIVTTTPNRLPQDVAVLLDEQVQTVHLSSDHAAAQFVERIAWAISDAEDAEGAPAERSQRRGEAPGRRRAPGTARRSLSAA
ncbi:MAG TPA: hypothetical protein VN772_04265 [Solirubrobacteraceae bacterium]|nr:hypothetical protein [Solirubrobacteraceae bacterium]